MFDDALGETTPLRNQASVMTTEGRHDADLTKYS
jgi:hypothetical protein